MTQERSLRLSARFASITEALAMIKGKDVAFAAACVGKLEAIEYMCLQALRKVHEETDFDGRGRHSGDMDQVISELHQEIKHVLQSFHRDICDHLALDQDEIIDASGAFKEVVNDICNQQG